jgi:predicted PurR-regulated permease PerM
MPEFYGEWPPVNRFYLGHESLAEAVAFDKMTIVPTVTEPPPFEPGPMPPSSTVPRFFRLRARKFARYSLLLMLLVTGLIFLNMVKIFLVPIILAAVFAGLFYPMFEWVVRVTRGRRAVSAFICCVLLSVGLLAPAYTIANLVAAEAVHLYQNAERRVGEFLRSDALDRLQDHPIWRRLRLANLPLESWLEQLARNSAQLILKGVNRVSRETFELIAHVLIAFFTMFYFFRDGPRLIDRLKYFSPLAEQYEEELIQKFLSVSRATIKGTVLVAILKGILGGLTLWIFGIEAATLWGVVMAILSVLPIVGPWLVMYPAGAGLIVSGDVWGGIAVLVIATFVISSLDNVLEPLLIGRDAGMHDLLVFFSMLGGIATFGVMGFLVGPIIAALFRTLLDFYGREFKRQLELVHNPPPSERQLLQG